MVSMSLCRIHCENREEWLSQRSIQGIGASESASACGCLSAFMTRKELFNLKVGITAPKDLSDNAAAQRGVQLEPVLREFFKMLHPDYKVEYYPYDILFQKERPWLFATLDGEVTKPDGKRFVLEIKTGEPKGKLGWEEWDGRVPDKYYFQNNHQLLATGYDGIIDFAGLFSQNGDITIKELEFLKEDMEPDMKYVLETETEFWGYCLRGIAPPPILTL